MPTTKLLSECENSFKSSNPMKKLHNAPWHIPSLARLQWTCPES
uniref:Uncharacterized protein n=1 Tax=Anguilla anguilla TaxID=7936 RepID=A0A0E9V4A0_ANGAN